MGNTVCILDGLNMKLLLVSTLALGVSAGTRQRRDGHAEGGDHDVMDTSVIDTNMDDYSDSSDKHGMGDHEKDGHGKGDRDRDGKGGHGKDGRGNGDYGKDGRGKGGDHGKGNNGPGWGAAAAGGWGGMWSHNEGSMGGRPMGGRNDDGNIIINNNVNSGGCDKSRDAEDMAEKIAMAVMKKMKYMMMEHGMDMPHDMDEPMEEQKEEPKVKKEKNKNKNQDDETEA